MATFQSFHGVITMIDDFWTGASERTGCYKIMSVEDMDKRTVNFVIMPHTYFVDNVMAKIGDAVIGFYDASVATPLIYPPQFRAIVMAKDSPNYNVKVGFFNRQLISQDGTLKLNIGPNTQILMENGQLFTNDISNRNLIVIYGITTRSIPAQTTPDKIIVMC